jgi:hypothetical protein
MAEFLVLVLRISSALPVESTVKLSTAGEVGSQTSIQGVKRSIWQIRTPQIICDPDQCRVG